jgi:hypothetical protein
MNGCKIAAPPPLGVRYCVGVTGHRDNNLAFAANRSRIEIVLGEIFELIDAATKAQAAHPPAGILPTRLFTLLAEGADQMAAQNALGRGWDLIAPLPFGLTLNAAIGASPKTVNDARALLAGGEVESAHVRERAANITRIASHACLFELADNDSAVSRLFLAALHSPGEPHHSAAFAAETSFRLQIAARVMIEHSDLLIAIWDGAARAFVGGTGHCVQVALELGTPVVWIDAGAPQRWQILRVPEALSGLQAKDNPARAAELQGLVGAALRPSAGTAAVTARHRSERETGDGLAQERWRARSNLLWHGFRRVEALFGANTWSGRFKSLRQNYESPDAIVAGSSAQLIARARTLPGQEDLFVSAIAAGVLRRFAWADGISTYLSDAYRGGITANFLLTPLAILSGIAYLPFGLYRAKWLFASAELTLLGAILAITILAHEQRWHARWFETRRVAEYLREGSILLLLGIARPPGRWPRGAETSWPEWYARLSLREVGLPRVRITQAYLRQTLRDVLDQHVLRQRDYHIFKAKRLAAAHRNLGKLSRTLFVLAIISVSSYLVIYGGAQLHWWPSEVSQKLSKVFIFSGVALPTLGGAVTGIRYFGDFERLAAISALAAEKLASIHGRIAQLLEVPEGALDYAQVADIARAADDVVVSEIQSWQAVLSAKHVWP